METLSFTFRLDRVKSLRERAEERAQEDHIERAQRDRHAAALDLDRRDAEVARPPRRAPRARRAQGDSTRSRSVWIAALLASTNAIGLIGRTVTYTDADDVAHTGTADKVITVDGKSSLTVAGVDGIDPATITQVA